MPVWYERTKPWRESGELAFVGLIQEQHPDRCALFLQWKRMEMPVLVDSLNQTRVDRVPLFWAVDEHGVVRSDRVTLEWLRDEFLPARYAPPEEQPVARRQEPAAAEQESDPVACFLRGEWDAAVDGFSGAVARDPGAGPAWFGLGCALRARYDSGAARPGDFAAAARAWTRALELEPGNYVWRRRIQQYGPRLDKPYPFYDWVAAAREEIRARGEEPRALRVEPLGAELAAPARELPMSGGEEPDPHGKIPRDPGRHLSLEWAIVPDPVQPGQAARLHFAWTPVAGAKWSHEAGPLILWLDPPADWWVEGRRFEHAFAPDRETSAGRVSIDLELRAPSGLGVPAALGGYVLYPICEAESGACVLLRQDFRVPL